MDSKELCLFIETASFESWMKVLPEAQVKFSLQVVESLTEFVPKDVAKLIAPYIIASDPGSYRVEMEEEKKTLIHWSSLYDLFKKISYLCRRISNKLVLSILTFDGCDNCYRSDSVVLRLNMFRDTEQIESVLLKTTDDITILTTKLPSRIKSLKDFSAAIFRRDEDMVHWATENYLECGCWRDFVNGDGSRFENPFFPRMQKHACEHAHGKSSLRAYVDSRDLMTYDQLQESIREYKDCFRMVSQIFIVRWNPFLQKITYMNCRMSCLKHDILHRSTNRNETVWLSEKKQYISGLRAIHEYVSNSSFFGKNTREYVKNLLIKNLQWIAYKEEKGCLPDIDLDFSDSIAFFADESIPRFDMYGCSDYKE